MVSVLQANLIGCRVVFVLSYFFKSKFSCSLLWRELYSRPFHWALTLCGGSSNRAKQKRQVRSQKLENRSRKLENRSRNSEVGSRKLEVGSRKWEVRRSSHSALSLNGQKSEIGSSHFVTESEVWSLKYEVLNLKSEVGSRKSEVGRPSSAFVTWDQAQFSFRFVITFRRARRNEI